jgi:hypothetical protein
VKTKEFPLEEKEEVSIFLSPLRYYKGELLKVKAIAGSGIRAEVFKGETQTTS